MPLAGTRIGVYEVLGLLGAGGMGEVYRARDTKLRRDVAIKVLPSAFVREPERLARFRREAQVLATLNHPHIAAIYGVEEADGVDALVLELVEGQTLAERIEGLRATGSGLPVDEALKIAAQIADALDAAHEKGIVHRDLKPANIKVTPDDQVKVLDFGLAKALADDLSADNTMSPTMTAMASRLGVIVGTAAYMSPEQAKGKPVDKRTDIWAFGCVLYEMLAGRRAFAGDDVTDLIVSVMTKEPEWTALSPATPRRIVELLHRCLKKDPRERLRDIGDARLELVAPSSSSDDDRVLPRRTTGRWRERLAWGFASLSVLTLSAGAIYVTRASRSAGVMRFVIPVTSNSRLREATNPSVAISPDGSTLAFVAADSSGNDLLWMRRLDNFSATSLAGTEGASFPFWAPDSQTIAFFAQRKLRTVPVGGGIVRVVCDAPRGWGGSWGKNGDIIFAPDFRTRLFRVPAQGGDVSPLTSLDEKRQERWHNAPHFFPDGDHFLFFSASTPEQTGVYLGSLHSTTTTLLLKGGGSQAVAASNGFILFARDNFIQAQRLEEGTLRPIGPSYAIAERGMGGVDGFSVSAAGTLAYRMFPDVQPQQFAWFDRTGRRLSLLGPAGNFAMPSLSPDGSQLAFARGDGNLWLMDVARGTATKFTSDGASAGPVWAPDGASIVYYSERDGPPKIYVKPSRGAGAEQILEQGPARTKMPLQWSADGKYVTYFQETGAGEDLFVLPMSGDHTPQVYLKTKSSEYENRISPDGRWMAYVSEETDRPEVYVQPFPRTDDRRRVSVSGGVQPIWRSDGSELFYLSLNGALMAAPVSNSPTFKVGEARQLFQVRTPLLYVGWSYAPSRDGQRFLVNTFSDGFTSPIGVVLNWPSAIPR